MAVSQIAVLEERVAKVHLSEASVSRDKPSEQIIGVFPAGHIAVKLFVDGNDLPACGQREVA
jgi:hypothetical protein